MYNYFGLVTGKWIGFVCAILIVGTLTVKAGTILLMNIGLGTPGAAPPSSCLGVADLSDGCALTSSLGIR